jgi:hypothetical protein
MRDLANHEAVGLVHLVAEKLAEEERAARRVKEWAEEAGFDERFPDQFDDLASLLGVMARTAERVEEMRRRVRAGEVASDELGALWRTAGVLEERLSECPLVNRFRLRS